MRALCYHKASKNLTKSNLYLSHPVVVRHFLCARCFLQLIVYFGSQCQDISPDVDVIQKTVGFYLFVIVWGFSFSFF